jgi:hypothetical protein
MPETRLMSGVWHIEQSNGAIVSLDIDQNGSNIKGVARAGDLQGTVKGKVTRDEFDARFDWDPFGPGLGGRYTGDFDGGGGLSGITVNLDDPQEGATWSADRAFQVVDANF